jgi:putative PIN family toxin of toxin-antitoxin system
MTNIFVFDTNSLISALLLPFSVARKAFDIALEKGILVHSRETFGELVEVFARPKFDKYISLDDRLRAISLLELKSQLIDVSVPVIACRDPKDLLVLHPFRETPILTPADFLNSFGQTGIPA